jgi:excisionase family DNA binding protein
MAADPKRLAETEPFVDGNKVARYLGVSYKTVMRWAGEKRIRSYKVGNTVRFRLSEVVAWMERQERRAS